MYYQIPELKQYNDQSVGWWQMLAKVVIQLEAVHHCLKCVIVTCLRRDRWRGIQSRLLQRIRKWIKGPSMHVHTPDPTVTGEKTSFRWQQDNFHRTLTLEWNLMKLKSQKGEVHLRHNSGAVYLSAEHPSIHTLLCVIAESSCLRPASVQFVSGTAVRSDPAALLHICAVACWADGLFAVILWCIRNENHDHSHVSTRNCS